MHLKRGLGGVQIVQENDFISEVVLEQPPDSENRLFFLLGDVGCGKTTYINHILAANAKTWFQTRDTWAVKLDIYTSTPDDTLFKDLGFIDLIHRRFIETMEHESDLFALGSHRDTFRRYLLPPEGVADAASCIRNFVVQYRRRFNRHLLFIFDNLDFLLHRHDMETFFPRGQDEYRNVLIF